MKTIFYALFFAVLSFQVVAQVDDSENFLPAEQAFQLKVKQENDQLQLSWHIAPKYYLYQQKIKVTPTLPLTWLSKPVIKQDPYFGQVPIFHERAQMTIRLSEGLKTLKVQYQGCAEAGLCYPPIYRQIELSPYQIAVHNSEKAVEVPDTNAEQTELQIDRQQWLWTLLVFFAVGLGLSFTPCILPMVPIVSAIVTQAGGSSVANKVKLSIAYVLGMATFYTLSGVLVAKLGASFNLQVKMQHPVVTWVIALLFAALALAMFGLYELRLPSALMTKLQKSNSANNGYIGAYIAGGVASLALSPCVSAPLASTLIYISTTGDTLFGGLALFCLSIGMGVPLILFSAGLAHKLPKTGAWMIVVKQIFGFIMMLMAIWVLAKVLTPEITFALLGVLGLWLVVELFELKPEPAGLRKVLSFVSLVVLVSASSVIFLAISQVLYPSAGAQLTEQHSSIVERLDSVAMLEQKIVANRTKKVVVDLYANWCASCQEIEQNVFAQLSASEHPNTVFLQLDLSNMDESKQLFLDKFKLFGPPAVMIFKPGDALSKPSFIHKSEFTLTQFNDWLRR